MPIFPNPNTPTDLAIAQHYEIRDLVINKLVDMYFDDYDIDDREIFDSVLARYGLLDDGFESEEEYIIKEVNRRINQ